MGKIQELSEHLANQIAAGEVVERPASVVKELVENAIDAGSTQIDILLEESGLRKIQIIDNGEGIAQEDVINAFKRHATSKIHTRDDLFRIRTLGFRGEALPSIASVSVVTIETAIQTQTQGTFLKQKGGMIEEHRPSALRQGTKITVENLFYNTPARLKYVKSLQTELSNVGDIVNRLALSHPTIAFRLVHDGNNMMSTQGNGDLKQALAGIYGVATAKKMRKVTAEDLDFRLTGYISLPEITRASRNYLTMMINGRYIKNFALNKAVVSGYGSKLMVGRFPIAAIDIQMDPLLVDVNVHPTKQEVRLSKEEELTALVSRAVNECLREENLIPNAGDNARFKNKVSQPAVEQLAIELETPKSTKTDLRYDPEKGGFYLENGYPQAVDNAVDKIGDKREYQKSEQFVYENQLNNQAHQTREEMANDPYVSSVDETQSSMGTEHPELKMTHKQTLQAIKNVTNKPVTNERFPYLEYFGQMHGTYLFAQSQQGLYIVDQHAAQERIKYEYFRKKIGEVGSDLQDLLVPIVLDYPATDLLKIKEYQPALEEVGIYLEDFGVNSLIARSHPTWFPAGQEEVTIREMIDMILVTGKISVHQFREATAIMMSCKKSIKANHYLDSNQARVLLEELAKCDNPFNCPHGRPVLIHFTNSDMERLFKRIQDSHQSGEIE